MDIKELLTEEEIEKISGGYSDGKMARVYSLDGGNVKLYESSFRGWQKTFRQAPNGSQMEVDPTLHPEEHLVADIVSEAGYWANYNNVLYYINEKEVRIEWA